MDGFDFSELTNFKKELMEDVAQDFPQDVQKFLDKEKRKLLKVVKKTAKANVGKKTGNYYKSLKAGKKSDLRLVNIYLRSPKWLFNQLMKAT